MCRLYAKIKFVIIIIVIMVACFVGGIFTANSEWFNHIFYIKSRQMNDLTIKSLKKYDVELFEKANSQTEMNIASNNRYKHYHEYYNRVVERINNYDFNDDKVKTAIISYIKDYEKRKELVTNTMFPYMKNSDMYYEYGTLFGMAYPKALLEFDRLELLTYQMILNNEYSGLTKEDIYKIFEY